MTEQALKYRTVPVARWTLVRVALVVLALLFVGALSLTPTLYVTFAVMGLLLTAAVLYWPVAGLCLLALSVPWGSGYAISVGSFPVTSTDVLVGLMATAWAVDAVLTRTNPLRQRIWTPFLVAFLLVLALSALQAADPRSSIREIVKWFELLVVFQVGLRFVTGRQSLRWLVASLVVAGVSQALLGLSQSVLQLGPEAFAHGAFLRAYGSFDQPNPFAGFVNMILPLAVAMALLGSSRERVWYGVATLFLAAALLASGSRGALLATMVMLCVVLACVWDWARRLVWTGVLAVIVSAWLALLGLVPTAPFERGLSAVGLGAVSFGTVNDANFSAVERAAHWVAGIRMFADHPLLGVGIGNYSVAYPAYHPRGWYAALAHAHNYYINIGAEAGILGLTTYLLVAGSALWYSYSAFRRGANRLECAAALGVLGALTATSFHNLFDVLYVHGMAALLGLLMVLVAVTLRDSSQGAADPSVTSATST